MERFKIKHPYDPDCWLQSAVYHRRLGFADLAVGDAYKALMLCMELVTQSSNKELRLGAHFGFYMHDAATHAHVNNDFREKINSLQEKAYHLLLGGLLALSCAADALSVYMRAIQQHPTASFNRYIRKIQGMQLHCPGFQMVRQYPYLQQRHLCRSDELIELIQAEFGNSLSGQPYPSPKCRLGKTPVGGDGDALGIFATVDIPRNDLIMVDSTFTGAIAKTLEGRCLSCYCRIQGYIRPTPSQEAPMMPQSLSSTARDFCSSRCGRGFIRTEKDFSWLQDAAVRDDDAFSNLVLLRFLMICTEEPDAHPLDHPAIARLVPQYKGNKPMRFTLAGNIKYPIKMLRSLGIDIFADGRYDTWILQTIQARIANNEWESESLIEEGKSLSTSESKKYMRLRGVNPLFSFFNHSCDPNVGWHGNSTTLRIRAYRDIKAGEELFVEYGDFRELPLEKRQSILSNWFPGSCECPRCAAEGVEARE